MRRTRLRFTKSTKPVVFDCGEYCSKLDKKKKDTNLGRFCKGIGMELMHGDTAWRQEPGPHLWHEVLPKGYVYRAAGPQGTMLPERALSDLWGQDSASFEAFCKIWVPLAYGAAEGEQVCHVLRAHDRVLPAAKGSSSSTGHGQ